MKLFVHNEINFTIITNLSMVLTKTEYNNKWIIQFYLSTIKRLVLILFSTEKNFIK